MDTTDKDRGLVKPNDVALVFRPLFENGEWTGRFQVIVSAFGPPTVDTEVLEELMGVAMLAATAVSFFEQDQEFAEALVKHGEETFKEALSSDNTLILTTDSNTHGRLH